MTNTPPEGNRRRDRHLAVAAPAASATVVDIATRRRNKPATPTSRPAA